MHACVYVGVCTCNVYIHILQCYDDVKWLSVNPPGGDQLNAWSLQIYMSVYPAFKRERERERERKETARGSQRKWYKFPVFTRHLINGRPQRKIRKGSAYIWRGVRWGLKNPTIFTALYSDDYGTLKSRLLTNRISSYFFQLSFKFPLPATHWVFPPPWRDYYKQKYVAREVRRAVEWSGVATPVLWTQTGMRGMVRKHQSAVQRQHRGVRDFIMSLSISEYRQQIMNHRNIPRFRKFRMICQIRLKKNI